MLRKTDDAPLTACSWPMRMVRGGLVAITAIGLADAGHVLGGGTAPGLGLLIVLWALVSIIVWLLSARQMETRSIAGVLILAQAFVHLTCSMSAGSASSANGMGRSMLLGHAIGVATALIVLRYGEKSLWSLLDYLLIRIPGLVRRPRALVVDAPRRVARSAWADLLLLHSFLLALTDAVRGPPRRLTVSLHVIR